MTNTSVQVVIPLEALVEAIKTLDLEDQIKLHKILTQSIQTQQQMSLEELLQERSCSTPLKQGLQETSTYISSGQANISVEHDRLMTDKFRSEF
jgi:hypothetical protein